MTDKYPIQFNVKVGDHLINVNAENIAEALTRLEQTAAEYQRIHAALQQLDGRPATQIVQKEKTWGARSRGGRSYPAATAQTTTTNGTGSGSVQQPVAAADPAQLLQQNLGATVVSTEQDSAAAQQPVPQAGDVPHSVMVCPLHGPRKYHGPGVNSSNVKYSASYRCTERGCATGDNGKSAKWQQKDGSWRV